MLLSRHATVSLVGLLVAAIAFADDDKPRKFPGGKPPDLGKVKLVRTLEQPNGEIRGLSFSPDSSRLVSSGGKNLYLWDPATGKEIARFEHKGEYMSGARFSPDGQIVAVWVGVGKEIRLLDATSGKILQQLRHPEGINAYAFSPDSKTLVTTGYDRIVRLWEVATGKELRQLRLRDPKTGKELQPKESRSVHDFEDLGAVGFSPDGKTVAVGHEDGSIRLCDVAKGTETCRLFHGTDYRRTIGCLAFSPNGKYLAAGGSRFKVTARLWNVSTGKDVREFRLPPSAIPAFLLQPRGTLGEPDPVDEGIYALAFSPDGKTLATSRYGTCLWEVATGRLRHAFGDPTIMETMLTFTPNGRLLAGGSINRKEALIHLWDWRDPCLEQPDRLGPRENEQLWADLAAEDAAVAYRAIATLRAMPAQAVDLLARRLQPIKPVPAEQLDLLLTQLDDDRPSVRELASKRLMTLGEAARSALQRTLSGQPSAEVRHRIETILAQLDDPPSPGQLRCLRAVEALESMGKAEAQQILQQLAGGAPGATETEDARAALKRLALK